MHYYVVYIFICNIFVHWHCSEDGQGHLSLSSDGANAPCTIFFWGGGGDSLLKFLVLLNCNIERRKFSDSGTVIKTVTNSQTSN